MIATFFQCDKRKEQLCSAIALLAAITPASALPSAMVQRSTPPLQTLLNESYAPLEVECPCDVQWVRPPVGLNSAEKEWVYYRKQQVLKSLTAYLDRLELEDFDVCAYKKSLKMCDYEHVPTLAFAISGGGTTSAYNGVGALRALDSRLPAAVEQGTGGLLQSLTYLAGQSGGSYPVISLSTYNFPTVDELLQIWQPWIDKSANATTEIFTDLGAKAMAGYNVSVADYLGRSTGFEYIPGPQGGLATTWSGVVNVSNFKNHHMPFPITQTAQITADDSEIADGIKGPNANNTLFEWTPYEFGAWDGTSSGFTPMEWLGTRLVNGQPSNKSACTKGFDRASLVLGSSELAYNYWYLEDISNNTLGQFSKRSLRNRLSKRSSISLATLQELAATFKQFFKVSFKQILYTVIPNFAYTKSSAQPINLQFVDATESGQALPLWPLLRRNTSFVFAYDANSDAAPYFWNNGTNLHDTYVRAKQDGLAFPIVPPAATFVDRNYTTRPVLFGCNANLTTTNDTSGPIVAYFANAPYSAYTNFSFTQNIFHYSQMNEIFVNGFNQMTQGNGTLAVNWTTCLGCAVVDRSLVKLGVKRTRQCQACMDKWCWDGVEDSSNPSVVDPSLLLNPSLGFIEWNKTNPF